MQENLELTQSNEALRRSNSQLRLDISNIFNPFASTAAGIQEMDAPANDISGTNLSLTITIDVNQLLTQQLPSLNGFITGELPFNCIKSSEAAKLLPSHSIIEDFGPNQDYFSIQSHASLC